MDKGEQRGPSWIGSVPRYAGILTAMVLARLGVFDPVVHAVGGWLGFGDRAAGGGGHTDRPSTSAADTAPRPGHFGVVPDDMRVPATPGGHKSTRAR